MLNVRVAQIEDIRTISHILATSWKSEYRRIIDDDYLNAVRNDGWVEFLTTGFLKGTIFSLILQENQEIVGATILGKSENEGEINLVSLYLLPDRIGKGLGHVLYSEVEIEMKKQGFTKCVLDVLEDNSRAIRFYEAHGFVEASVGMTITLGEKNYTCKVFEKQLF